MSPLIAGASRPAIIKLVTTRPADRRARRLRCGAATIPGVQPHELRSKKGKGSAGSERMQTAAKSAIAESPKAAAPPCPFPRDFLHGAALSDACQPCTGQRRHTGVRQTCTNPAAATIIIMWRTRRQTEVKQVPLQETSATTVHGPAAEIGPGSALANRSRRWLMTSARPTSSRSPGFRTLSSLSTEGRFHPRPWRPRFALESPRSPQHHQGTDNSRYVQNQRRRQQAKFAPR